MRFRILTHPALENWAHLEITSDSNRVLFMGDLTRADMRLLQREIKSALGSTTK